MVSSRLQRLQRTCAVDWGHWCGLEGASWAARPFLLSGDMSDRTPEGLHGVVYFVEIDAYEFSTASVTGEASI